MMLRRLALLLLALVLAGEIRPVVAQGPAVEFMLDQLRQREAERRRALQQQQQELQQRALRQQQLQQRRAREAAIARQRAANEVSDQSPTVEELPKDPNARTVLVIGDEMVTGLAQGLREAFASEPTVLVVPLARPQSGLATRTPADWPDIVRDALRRETPLAVVVMLGLHDRRPITEGSLTAEFPSDRWRELYGARIDALFAALATRRVPVYWTGLPAMRDPEASSAASVLNDLFKARAFAASQTFVDVWEGFVDEEGRYVPIGPDQNGNSRRLRAPDGVGLTPAGFRKLAFYVEGAMRRDLPIAAPPAIAALTPPTDTPPEALRPVDPTQPPAPDVPRSFIGPVVQITPAPVRPSGELAGAPVRRDASHVAHRVLVRGDPLPEAEGRADDFRWPPPTAARAAAAPAATAESTAAAAAQR